MSPPNVEVTLAKIEERVEAQKRDVKRNEEDIHQLYETVNKVERHTGEIAVCAKVTASKVDNIQGSVKKIETAVADQAKFCRERITENAGKTAAFSTKQKIIYSLLIAVITGLVSIAFHYIKEIA